MSTDGIPGTPFEVLGVPLDADGRAVRRAFADKLREARGSGDADAVRRVQDAFEAIRDDLPREQLRRYSENEARLGPLLLEADAENLPRLKFTSARERDYDVRLGSSRRAPCSDRSRFSPRRWLPRIRLPTETRRSRPARCWAR